MATSGNRLIDLVPVWRHVLSGMGWSSVSEIAVGVIEAVRENVPDKRTRRAVYKALIEVQEAADWDTQDEAMGVDEVFDAVLLKRPG